MLVTVPELWDYKKYGDGVVAAWFKKEGSAVKKNDLLCQVMVVKVTFDIRSPVEGRVTKIIAPKGMKVKPGDALLEVAEEAVVEIKVPEERKEVEAVPEKAVRATPAARRAARELGIDLALITGSGPGGLITEGDVKEYAKKAKHVYKSLELTGLRKIIADRMLGSLKSSAQVTLHREVDITELVDIREKELKDEGLTYTDFMVKAVAQALREHPYMNAHIVEDEVRLFENIDIGVAVAVEQGLLVPVIRDVDKKSLKEISKEIKELTSKARQGTLSPEQLTGSTFTLTNLGMYGIDYFTPIINPPEVAILGVGNIVERPVFREGQLVSRKFIRLSLTFDHRVVDGAPASEFLAKIATILSSPRRYNLV